MIITLTFLALIATNILTLTNTAFNAALSGLMGTALDVRTVSSIMQSKLADETPNDVMHSVCNPELREAGQVVWVKF